MERNSNLMLGMRAWTLFGKWSHLSVPSGWDVPFGSPVSLRFLPGLNVLYGRNGAGKSSLLHLLKAGLTGRATYMPVELYVRVPVRVGREGFLDPGTSTPVTDVTAPHLPADLRVGALDVPMSWSDVIDAALTDWSSRGDFKDRRLAEAALQTRCLALIPVGVDRPRWQVWLAADTSNPVMEPWIGDADQLLSRWKHAFDAWDDARERGDDSDELDRMEELEWETVGHPLFSTIWTRPTDRSNGRAGHLEPMHSIWEQTGIPTRPVDGLPVPVARLGTSEHLMWPRALFEVGDDALQRLLHHETRRRMRTDSPAELEAVAREIGGSADAYYSGFLADSPALEVQVAPEYEWPFGGALSWRATDFHPLPRPLARFSAAQARWARFSAMLASATCAGPLASYERDDAEPEGSNDQHMRVRVDDLAPRILMIDEPELHLHRSAESHMAQGLQRLTEDAVDYLFVATHSPDLLNIPDAHLFWINDGQIQVLTGTDTGQLDGLGLKPSDLLGITRVLLLVEGHHDELVLDLTVGEQLRLANTRIVPLNGGRNLAAVADSQVLFEFTNAHVLGLLDNISAGHMVDVWEHALVLRATEGLVSALEFINTSLPGKNRAENVYMRAWFMKAIEKPDSFPHSRMSPFGLEKADIVEYLPVEAFVRKARSWDELRTEHTDKVATGQLKDGRLRNNFKEWVTRTYDTDFGDDRIRQAVAMMPDIPEEFEALAHVCADIGRRRPDEVGL